MDMNEIIMEWLPAISTTSLFSLILWLSRNLIITRLTNSVRHEYDKKIEDIRSDLRKKEEGIISELKIKEIQIQALQSGALSGVSNRQAAIFEKQVKAIESVWGTIISLGPAKVISNQLQVIKFESALKEAATNSKVREMFSMMSNVNIENIEFDKANKARPFISTLSWAYYSAYLSIVMHAVIKMKMLQTGVDHPDIIDNKHLMNLIKAALPHQVKLIEDHGIEAIHYLLDELEEKLLLSFQLTLKGEELDKEHVEMASKIIKTSESLMAADKLSADQDSY
jgi:hypothetical protein